MTPLKGKAPYLKDWPNKASNDAGKVSSWLAENRNVGLVTGNISGVVVIDVDPRNGGDTSMLELVGRCGDLPETIACNTGGGGRHLYFRYYDGAKSTKPLEGIDFQCDGRCVVTPPSVHPETGALYEWKSAPGDTELAELPSAWREALQGRKTLQVRALAGLPIPQGRRNDTLFRLGVEKTKTEASESVIQRFLTEENALYCQPPLKGDEVATIARRCTKYRPSNVSLKTQWQLAIWDSSLSRVEKIVLQALAAWANAEGRNCFPTQEMVGQRSSTGRKAVRNVLRKAASRGWLIRITNSRAVGSGFNYSYILTLPKHNQDG